jgi:hypothetical protein
MTTNPALDELRFLAGRTEITGSWQKSVDGGLTWEHDFKVRYTRHGEPG